MTKGEIVARRKGPLWTDEERERLLAMKASGMKHAAIAAALGRPVGAVTGELYNLRHPVAVPTTPTSSPSAPTPRNP